MSLAKHSRRILEEKNSLKYQLIVSNTHHHQAILVVEKKIK